MIGNDLEQIGQFNDRYLDRKLNQRSTYAKFLTRNRGVDEGFYEYGWVKLLDVLTGQLADYQVTNSLNHLATASNDVDYQDYNGNVAVGDRAGYKTNGWVSRWTLYRVRFDRCTSFKLDIMDLKRTGIENMVGPILDEFYANAVIPEMDLVYSSIIADCTSENFGNRVVSAATADNALQKLLDAETHMFEKGVDSSNTAIVMSRNFYNMLLNSKDWTKFFYTQPKTFGEGIDEVTLRITYFNDKPIFLIQKERFYTDALILAEGGWAPSATSRYINFLMVDIGTLYPIIRLNKLRTYDDSVINDYDGIKINLHLWYDLIITKNKKIGVYADVSNESVSDTVVAVSVLAKPGAESGQTVIEAISTSPIGLMYNKVYVKTTAFGEVGTAQSGGTLVAEGSPFVPADDQLYVALTDFNGNIVAKTSVAVDFPTKD